MAIVNLEEVARLVNKQLPDAQAYVEQTGGGCATVYAGVVEGLSYREALVAAGPGWFDGPNWTEGRADTGDLCVGVNDQGEHDPAYADPTSNADDIAGLIINFLTEHPFNTCDLCKANREERDA